MAEPLFVRGMHGLGDNIRSRAIIRDLLVQHQVMLSTPWPCVFEDLMPSNRLAVMPAHSSLRTQAKNERREGYVYSRAQSHNPHVTHLWYPSAEVIRQGSILGAMYVGAGLPAKSVDTADFTLVVPDYWTARAQALLPQIWNDPRPLLIYRPLVARTEWSGCAARNPDFNAYTTLYERMRQRFCVVSVADLEDRKEWLVGNKFEADHYFHKGELSFEILAALYYRASLVYCSPGFSAVLAQAVGTRYVLMFGGYENSRFWPFGLNLPPYLHIDTIRPCECFAHGHACEKRIDMDAAASRLDKFVEQTLGESHASVA